MLSRLSIENYALIDKTTIDFHEGFTVITGETGAGKSIMLDALTLLRGARADSKAMGDKDKKTVVEGVFTHPEKSISLVCEENGIEWDDNELILRREISPSGKSRGFVNDTPVTLNVLSQVSENLVDIHSQHSNSLLNKPQEQLHIIDSFGDNTSLTESYKTAFHNYVKLRNQIKAIKESIARSKENKEYISFRLEQLDKLKPKRGELASLEREFEILSESDRINSALTESTQLLETDQLSVFKLLQNVNSILSGIDIGLLDPEGRDQIIERLNSLKIELRDITDTLNDYSEKVSSDPERYDKVRQRIDNIDDVMKRFKVKDEEELVRLHEKLKEEWLNLSGDTTDLNALENELKEKAKDLKEKADHLTAARQKAAENLSETIMKTVIPLGMPNIRFNVKIEKGKMTMEGQDIVTFYCSFNKNHNAQPLSEIASGGEISRVMLGLKSIMARKMELPTMIFDEIDTGVSGEIAHKMGKMMKAMSKSLQVMSVTHLPQVAASGDSHLKVYKTDNTDKTISQVKELNQIEREIEIAGMLSGNSINDVALENARILLSSD
ncbi:MAG: DNA repair protein RecN [Muribaculaceae bacterium]|nr:DNA repair protein RecN [Muribaculaceae bacterium]